MAHIKEPEGIDFLIKSPPLSEQERKEISNLIKKLKSKSAKKISTTLQKKNKEMAE
nr:hypothetical protein [Bacteroidota bacterium]